MQKIVVILVILLSAFSAESQTIGVNFRNTAGLVTDGANETYSLCNSDVYATSRAGFNLGRTGGSIDTQRDREATADRRLAGVCQRENNLSPSQVWRIDLGGTAGGPVINNVLRSEEFNDAGWVKTNATVTADSTAAPNAVVNADTFIPSAGTALTNLAQAVTLTAGNHRFCVSAKPSGYSFIQLNNSQLSSVANYDITTGVLGTNTGNVSSTITALTNGWYRICQEATYTAGSVTFIIALIETATTVKNGNLTANGTSGVFLSAASINPTSAPNVYLRTFGTALTAGQYDIALSLGDFYNSRTHFFQLLASDNATVLLNFNGVATTANQYVDAAGNLRSNAAWISTGSLTKVRVPNAGTSFFLRIGQAGANTATTSITHMNFEKVATFPVGAIPSKSSGQFIGQFSGQF